MFRVRQSSLDACLSVLDAGWDAGCHNGADLWRRLRDQGFPGSLRVVAERATRRRRADKRAATLAAARTLVERFQTMIQSKAATELDGWTEQAKASLLAPLVAGVAQDVRAVRAAIIEPWSSGQPGGQITRLKLVKREMDGGSELDLFETRLLGAR